MKSRVCQLTQELEPLISEVVAHPLYCELSSVSHLRCFMAQHVFAVWDFMCLLKELHRKIVVTAAPWFPPQDALSANLIGTILAEEEGDVTEAGVQYVSHYELYLSAMESVGADTRPIRNFLACLAAGGSVISAAELIALHPATKNFVLTTFGFFKREVHELAAVFTYGREGITSGMFLPLLEKLECVEEPEVQRQIAPLKYYLKRHIELDGAEHFPNALTMLSNLAGNDEKKWEEAKAAAEEALLARIEFLSAIQELVASQPACVV